MSAERFAITCDLFQLPDGEDGPILYAPELGFACKANKDLANLLTQLGDLPVEGLTRGQVDVLKELERQGLVNGVRRTVPAHRPPQDYSPTQVTLFPSNQCNLRCAYCYASAGSAAVTVMSIETARQAINLVIRNLKAAGQTKLSLGFHGGGEPFYDWHWIRNVVSYAAERTKEEGLSFEAHSATNGILSEAALQWVVQALSGLNISFDGLPEIQNLHRPMTNGEGSFDRVDRTLRYLDAHNFSYGLRSTISIHNLALMEDCLEYMTSHYRPRVVHFEPLNSCGRCATSGTLAPDLEEFSEGFLRCLRRAAELGVKLVYSGAELYNLKNSFCGVARDNFAVTPDGDITTCFEVTSKDDPRAATFFIGRIGQDGQLAIDAEKRRFLHSLTVEGLDYCRDCFAKWHCAGECAVKLGHSDYNGRRGHSRCRLNRQLLRDQVVKTVSRSSPPAQEAPAVSKDAVISS